MSAHVLVNVGMVIGLLPIIGIPLPLVSFGGTSLLSTFCMLGLVLSVRLHRYEDDPPVVMAMGIEHAIRQCRRLLDEGVPGIHFYTLNKSHATRSILAAIREI